MSVKREAAGDMRHLVRVMEHKIESGTTGYDSFGQVSASSTAWQTIRTTRAKIEQISATEMQLTRNFPKATHLITVDFDNVLASTGAARRAVVYRDRFLHIGAVINEEFANIKLQLLCGEER